MDGTPAGPDGPRLRVALVCPYSLSRPGGVQGQVAGLARAYRLAGHDVAVLAPVDGEAAPIGPGIELWPTGRSVPVPANGSVAPVNLSPVAVRRALRHLRSWGADIVHVHEPFAPGVPAGLLVARDLPPEVATFHRSGASHFYRALGPVVRRLGRRLDVCCAVSSAARATAANAVDRDIEVLFNGIECDRYEGAEPWPTDRPTVLFLGRHEERKGLAVLLEAFDRLRRRGGERCGGIELWLAGDGPQSKELRRQWPPDDDVRWLGTVPDAVKIRRLRGATLLCAPSRGQESFGLVLLEAMAARTAVVASDIPGYRAAAGEHAVLVPPDRPDALAEALAGVVEERLATSGGPGPDGRAAWLDAAQAHARSYSMPRLAVRYEEVFSRTLQDSAR